MNRIAMAVSVCALGLAASAQARDIHDPQGNPPEGGWPVLVYISGYGVTQDAFDRLVALATDEGMAVVNLDTPNSDGRKPQWTERIQYAHARLQSFLGSLDKKRYDLGSVHLCGYGQGAVHAALAVMTHPQSYGGALAVSPASAAQYPESWKSNGRNHPLYLLYSSGEARDDAAGVNALRSLWAGGGGAIREYQYPGVAGDYDNWEASVREGLDWIMGYRVSGGSAR